ncbi:hypothetical protein A2160_02975 [Candidatus Beckwithbacteria bacterium RBG_13_42_9]|uniref:Uncharacterized protein n=1 Tax=Candidatus Beckwithbacteria bacterium RBG_13_42_9 TaxID=1797457 RepID=A0A1F5E7W7_9BACT|nr:MAG: hypothetical protein A2160_02975 [Candidatus Beckwithbacteria bacterium RBG_13_42_9]
MAEKFLGIVGVYSVSKPEGKGGQTVCLADPLTGDYLGIGFQTARPIQGGDFLMVIDEKPVTPATFFGGSKRLEAAVVLRPVRE